MHQMMLSCVPEGVIEDYLWTGFADLLNSVRDQFLTTAAEHIAASAVSEYHSRAVEAEAIARIRGGASLQEAIEGAIEIQKANHLAGIKATLITARHRIRADINLYREDA